MQPFELKYIEKNGLLYPDLQISNNILDDKRPIGKYGMMWLKFMKEHHINRYNELKFSGELMSKAHKINDESHEMITIQSKNITNLIDYEINVIREFVLVIR